MYNSTMWINNLMQCLDMAILIMGQIQFKDLLLKFSRRGHQNIFILVIQFNSSSLIILLRNCILWLWNMYMSYRWTQEHILKEESKKLCEQHKLSVMFPYFPEKSFVCMVLDENNVVFTDDRKRSYVWSLSFRKFRVLSRL